MVSWEYAYVNQGGRMPLYILAYTGREVLFPNKSVWAEKRSRQTSIRIDRANGHRK